MTKAIKVTTDVIQNDVAEDVVYLSGLTDEVYVISSMMLQPDPTLLMFLTMLKIMVPVTPMGSGAFDLGECIAIYTLWESPYIVLRCDKWSVVLDLLDKRNNFF